MNEQQKSQPPKSQAPKPAPKPGTPGVPSRPESKRQDPKTTLTMLKWTTGLSAVALTLAGWGLLARAETVNAATVGGLDQTAPASLTLGSAAASKLAALGGPGQVRGVSGLIASAPADVSARSSAAAVLATPTRGAAAAPTDSPTATTAPTDVPTNVPTDVPTDVPTVAPTATPEVKFKLDVVQWVQNQAGDNIAVVRDNQGILWYVWGDDVPRIEQGLSPQYQPVPVNQFGRSRHS